MDRYEVEQRVDKHIDRVKVSIKAKMWNIAKDIGWSTLSQIGEIVSFVKGEMKYEDITRIDTMAATPTQKRNAFSKKDTEAMRKESSSESLLARKPSHSVLESLSSFSSIEDLNQRHADQATKEEREIYMNDFVAMLREGLYVFAAYDGGRSSNARSRTRAGQSDRNESEKKRFRLRVFFYQDHDSMQQDDNDVSEKDLYFVLHPVEGGNRDDIEIIPIDEIKDIRRSGTNGIEFITYSNILSASSHSSDEDDRMIDRSESEASLVRTASMVTAGSTPSIPEGEEIKHVATDDTDDSSERSFVMAEIVLSNVQDRETLFQGLKTCFPGFRQGRLRTNDESNDVVGSVSGTDSNVHNYSPVGDTSDNCDQKEIEAIASVEEKETEGQTDVLDSDAEMVDWNCGPNLTNECAVESEEEEEGPFTKPLADCNNSTATEFNDESNDVVGSVSGTDSSVYNPSSVGDTSDNCDQKNIEAIASVGERDNRVQTDVLDSDTDMVDWNNGSNLTNECAVET